MCGQRTKPPKRKKAARRIPDGRERVWGAQDDDGEGGIEEFHVFPVDVVKDFVQGGDECLQVVGHGSFAGYVNRFDSGY